ncbi:hypothetical protein [Spirulina subsalsa]|uniref:hypothetical protein n=1 Tax=Spirulina subsalsa TaxID=54311 RepID=UPI0013DEA53C|nr:hypothetical protein [Spirulina subsalsa]
MFESVELALSLIAQSATIRKSGSFFLPFVRVCTQVKKIKIQEKLLTVISERSLKIA